MHRRPASRRTSEAYRLLYRSDVAVKRGEMPAEVVLDLLVAQLERGSDRRLQTLRLASAPAVVLAA